MNRLLQRMGLSGTVLTVFVLVATACTSQAVPAAPAATNTSAPAAAAPTTAPAATEAPTATAVALATDAPAATEAPATSLPAATDTAEPAAVNCTPGQLTPAETEGPYYKANPPEESALYSTGMSGTPLTITGYVLDASCKPIAGARVDFWQADAAGQYDNSGYTLRGYQLTDAQGAYRVVTVVPGLYPGRTRHIHVKVTPPNGATLTTQLYFPDVAQNSSDPIFDAQNLLTVQLGADGETATFNFVVAG